MHSTALAVLSLLAPARYPPEGLHRIDPELERALRKLTRDKEPAVVAAARRALAGGSL